MQIQTLSSALLGSRFSCSSGPKMAVSRVRLSSFLLLVVFFCICSDLGLGHQSPASHHSCSHDHHHHYNDFSVSHHDHDHHDHHQSHDEAKGKTKKNMLPEELAEEEDLKLYGFRSGSDHHDHDRGGSQLSGVGLWVKAMGCSLLVSMASLICLTIIPVLCVHGNPSKGVVDVLAVFGAGAMLGDAFLHQLPHAFSGGHSHSHDHHDHSEHSHSHAHSHSHSLEDLSIGLSVLSGIVVFLIVEKIVRFVEEISGGENSWAHHHHHHQHHHHKTSKKLKDEDDTHDKSLTQPSKDSDANTSSNSKLSQSHQLRKRNTKVSSSDGESDVDAAKGKMGEEKTASQSSNLVFGYLNLFSDGVVSVPFTMVSVNTEFLHKCLWRVRNPIIRTVRLFISILQHNFTDGMALGSAFLLHGSVGGWSRTLFLLAHELPQEVGDFGILVRSGFSVSKALFFNFLSALVALAGTALALLLGKDPGQSSLIEGFTAGGFIYISVAGVLAEMNNNGSTSLRSSVSQLASLLLGMGIALYISLVE